MRGRGERVRARRRPRRTPGPGWGWSWPRPQPLTPRSCLLLSPGRLHPHPTAREGARALGSRKGPRGAACSSWCGVPSWWALHPLVATAWSPPRQATSVHGQEGGARCPALGPSSFSLEAPLRPGQRPQRFPARRSHGPPARRVPARPSPSPKTRLPSFVPKTRHRVIQL